jgi:hypothetical protein
MRPIGGLSKRDREIAQLAFQAVQAGPTSPSPEFAAPTARALAKPFARAPSPPLTADPATPPRRPPGRPVEPLRPQQFHPPTPRKFVPVYLSSDEEFDAVPRNRSAQSSPVRLPATQRTVPTGTRFIHRRTGEALVCIVPADSGKLVLMNEGRQQIVKCWESDLIADSRSPAV